MSTQFNFGSVPALNLNPTTNAFNFGTNTVQSSATLPSLQTTTTSSGFSFGSAVNPLQSSSLVPNQTLTLTTASTSVTQTLTQQTNSFHGLGGTQTTSSESSADQSLKANKANKESTFIPPEMTPLVEALKAFVKEQKVIREENSQQRFSIQPILEVGSEIEDSLRLVLHKIEVDIQRNSKAIDALKRDTNKLLSSAEMAYRISRVDFPQTPSSYSIAQNKYINASTHQYFIESIDNFETQINNYSKQIQDLRTHIENMNKPYSSEELLQIMRKQHQTLISLAAKVYAIHEEVNQFKLNLKNQSTYGSKLVETTNDSQMTTSSPKNKQSFVGPNPFGLTGDERHFVGEVPHNQSMANVMIGGTGLQTMTSPMPSLNPMSTTTSSSVQFSPSMSTISTSHSRAKRWTTS